MWSLMFALAVAQDEIDAASIVLPEADVVLHGVATRAEPGDRKRIWDMARQADFQIMLPGSVLPVVCLKVTEVLYGSFLGEKACFYRASALSLATEDLSGTGDQVVGRDAVWMLRESDLGGAFLFARDREAVQPAAYATAIRTRTANTKGRSSLAAAAVPSRPIGVDKAGVMDLIAVHDLAAVPALRAVLDFGSASEKIAVIEVVAELGVLPLVGDVVAHVDDADRLLSDVDPIGRPVGTFATEALFALAPRLDGRLDTERSRDQYGFMPGGIDFDLRAASVEQDWQKWWDEWKAEGPVR